MDFKSILKAIKEANNIAISAHTNPDGDAIGAMVAMGHICQHYNKKYTILLETPSREFKALTDTCICRENLQEDADTFIALDCGDVDRLVGYELYFKKAHQTINIDHHITNTSYALHNYVEPEASSTSELVYKLTEEAQIELTVEMAQALYTGILTDTGGFMHSCTHASTHLAAAKLITLPFNFSQLYETIIHEKTMETVKLQSKAVDHLKKLHEKGTYLTYITEQDLQEIGASKEDIDGVISYLKTIKGTNLVAFIYPKDEKANTYKLSMRSNPPYDVAHFCKQFGGGGHARAAGATLEGQLSDVLERIEMAMQAFVES